MRRIVVLNPNTTVSMTDLSVESARRIVGEGTHVVGVTSPAGPVSIESHYDEALAVPGMLQAMLAEPAADAFVLACFGDPGLDAAREVVDVPVIGIAEAGMKAASLLGRSFSVVTTMSRTVGRAWDLARVYGLERQCAGVHATDIPVLDLESNKEATYLAVLTGARLALEQDGSDAVVLGCAGMADLPERLSAALGVPVVDGVAAGAAFAEGLLRQGLVPARHGELAGPPPKPYTGFMAPFADAGASLAPA